MKKIKIAEMMGSKDKKSTLMEEAGVLYSHYQQNPDLKEFKYVMEYLPTGTNFDRSVWCFSENDFYKLIAYWNRNDKWKITTASKRNRFVEAQERFDTTITPEDDHKRHLHNEIMQVLYNEFEFISRDILLQIEEKVQQFSAEIFDLISNGNIKEDNILANKKIINLIKSGQWMKISQDSEEK